METLVSLNSEMNIPIHAKCMYLLSYSREIMNKPESIFFVEHEIEQLMPSIGQIKSGDEIAPRISI